MEPATVINDVEARFDDFVRAQRVSLVRYATLLAGSRAPAEDLVQEVLVRLYPRWSQLDEPLPYVRRCITNEFLSWQRRWSTRHIRAVPDEDLDRPIDENWDRGPDPDLWARLGGLPGQQRAAIVLRFYEGLPDDEIAELLSCRPGTVRAHVSRGLRTLHHTITTPEQGQR